MTDISILVLLMELTFIVRSILKVIGIVKNKLGIDTPSSSRGLLLRYQNNQVFLTIQYHPFQYNQYTDDNN